MFFQLRSIFPQEGLQCEVYEGRNSIPRWESQHVLSVEKHFFLGKVYDVESMREGTLFPGQRGIHVLSVESIFPYGRFTVWSIWGKELYSPVRECTIFTFHACVSLSWESFFPRKGLQCGIYKGRNSIPRWERECTCPFSWEAFLPLEGLQCGVYERRNSIPRWESVHVL